MKKYIYSTILTISLFLLSGSTPSSNVSSEMIPKSVFDSRTIQNIKDYGATGNGIDDDTSSIQRAINEVSQRGGGVVLFPSGEYAIDATKSIVLADNITLLFDHGTKLLAIPNKSETYSVIKIRDAKNIALVGGVRIVGERNKHQGSTGEWGFGISITGSTNVLIQNPVISDFWGDGIYIGSTSKQSYSENITIINPVCDNNRRQGISVVSAKNVDIINPKIYNTNGTKPQYGIDIEPNYYHEVIQNIRIINPIISGNVGGGILFSLFKISGPQSDVSIEVINGAGIQDSIDLVTSKGINGTIMIDNKNILK